MSASPVANGKQDAPPDRAPASACIPTPTPAFSPASHLIREVLGVGEYKYAK
jgi:hypothetical protein